SNKPLRVRRVRDDAWTIALNSCALVVVQANEMPYLMNKGGAARYAAPVHHSKRSLRWDTIAASHSTFARVVRIDDQNAEVSSRRLFVSFYCRPSQWFRLI